MLDFLTVLGGKITGIFCEIYKWSGKLIQV